MFTLPSLNWPFEAPQQEESAEPSSSGTRKIYQDAGVIEVGDIFMLFDVTG